MIYEAVVKALEMTYDPFPPSPQELIDALEAHRDGVRLGILKISMSRFEEHIRLNTLQRRAESLLRARGHMSDTQTLDLYDHHRNRMYVSRFPALSVAVTLFEEIEVGCGVVDGLKRIEDQRLRELNLFEYWMQSPVFEDFIDAYAILSRNEVADLAVKRREYHV